ncbi:MAG: universal stress protein [Synergistales bacterium]|nr:universal stress protein [Synergistales bacterium]
MGDKILVAIDESSFSESLVEYALSSWYRYDLEKIVFIHVVEGRVPTRAGWNINFKEIEPSLEEELLKKFHDMIGSTVEKMKLREIPYELILKVGEPSSTIVEVSEKGDFDLIVIGHKGLSNIERFFIGSVAANVVRHAPCSVHVYRPKD